MPKNNKFSHLICPIDSLQLIQKDNSLICENKHCFDIAKQGYVNLLPVHFKKSKNPGDSKEMVIARKEFLNYGFYEPIAEKLAQLIENIASENNFILDAGCGEGYYLNYINKNTTLSNLHFLGLDISKEAVTEASKQYKEISWIVASNRQLPVEESSVDVLICQFGFPFYEEFKRVLKPGGKLILVDTAPNHLIEIRKIIYETVKLSDLPYINKALENGFTLSEIIPLTYTRHLSSNDYISQLLAMTPHLFRATKQGKELVKQLSEISITIDVAFRVLSI